MRRERLPELNAVTSAERIIDAIVTRDVPVEYEFLAIVKRTLPPSLAVSEAKRFRELLESFGVIARMEYRPAGKQ